MAIFNDIGNLNFPSKNDLSLSSLFPSEFDLSFSVFFPLFLKLSKKPPFFPDNEEEESPPVVEELPPLVPVLVLGVAPFVAAPPAFIPLPAPPPIEPPAILIA